MGGGGEEQEASALLSKKKGMEGSIKSQQKFDFFCYDIMPNSFVINVYVIR